MTARPIITRLDSHFVSSGNEYLHPFLRNDGSSVLKSGTLYVKQTSKDGSVESKSFFNNTDLDPGETTKLIEQFFDAKRLVFVKYAEARGKEYSLNISAKRGWFRWSLK